MMIQPQWPVPQSVGCISTTRQGGVSLAPYVSFNLGVHVDDCLEHVLENRHRLSALAQLPSTPVWLQQVHGVDVIQLTQYNCHDQLVADAVYTRESGIVCAILTADCLPVLFCSRQGDEVAAAHAGWKGLVHGVLENTVALFRHEPDDIMVWLGPAIGASAFEVGEEVRTLFVDYDQSAEQAFLPHPERSHKYLCDIYALARQRLMALGIQSIYGGEYCTFTDQERFFSYRREKQTGRMASLIWINP